MILSRMHDKLFNVSKLYIVCRKIFCIICIIIKIYIYEEEKNVKRLLRNCSVKAARTDLAENCTGIVMWHPAAENILLSSVESVLVGKAVKNITVPPEKHISEVFK